MPTTPRASRPIERSTKVLSEVKKSMEEYRRDSLRLRTGGVSEVEGEEEEEGAEESNEAQ